MWNHGNQAPPSFCKRISGFTLIEMAMVTLIGGIIMASAGTAMTSFLDQARVDTTRIRMEGIENALRQYLSANNKYPCPAALILQQDNVNYGREINVTCSAAGAVAGTSVVRGRTIGAVAQNIRVGAVPVRSLNLPDTYMTDGWGNRFYFAMTEELATPPPPPGGTFMADRGGVAIFDGVVGAPPNLITDRAQYAIISPGPNRVGAFNMAGIQAIPCPPELPAATGTVEASNCTFQNPAAPAPKQFRSTLNVSTATVQEAYDDFVTFRTSAEANIALPPCAAGEIRVGLNCQALPAPAANCPGANEVRVGAVCLQIPNCALPNVLTWTGAAFACNPPCPPGEALVGNGCQTLPTLVNNLLPNCPVGEVLVTNVAGAPVCATTDDLLPNCPVNTVLSTDVAGNPVCRPPIANEGCAMPGTFVRGFNLAGNLDCAVPSGGPSDLALKKEVHPLHSTLDQLDQLNGVTWQWKDRAEYGSYAEMGLIAQDVEKVYPAAVTENSAGVKYVQYQALIGPLVEAVKELNHEVKALRREVEDIRNTEEDFWGFGE